MKIWIYLLLVAACNSSVHGQQLPLERSGLFSSGLTRLDVNLRPGSLYRLRILLSPKFVSFFGSLDEQNRIRTVVSQRLSLRNPSIAEAVRHVTVSTSETEAKRVFSQLNKKYSKIAGDTETELRVALDDYEWLAVVKTHAGLLAPSLHTDREVSEFFALSDRQKNELRNIERKNLERTSSVSPSEEVDSSTDKAIDWDKRRDQVASVLNFKQKAQLDECIRHASDFVASEQKRVSPGQLLFDTGGKDAFNLSEDSTLQKSHKDE